MPQLSIDAFVTKKLQKLSTASDTEPDSKENLNTNGEKSLMDATESVESSRQASSLEGGCSGDLVSGDSIQKERKELETNSPEKASIVQIIISDDEDQAKSPQKLVQGNDKDSNDIKENVKKEENSHVEKKKTKKPKTEFVVESIKDHRFRNDKMEYLVKWKNYPNSDNSWEPENHLINCTSILDTYASVKERVGKYFFFFQLG